MLLIENHIFNDNIENMKGLKRTYKVRNILYSLPILIVLCFVTVFLSRGAIKVVEKQRESAKITHDLEERATSLALREEEVKKGIIRLETEEGLKEEIREKLSVAQEGEYMAVIVEDLNVASSTDDTLGSWFKRLWGAIISAI